MRHLLLGRTLLGVTVLTGVLLAGAGTASAAPPQDPRPATSTSDRAGHPHRSDRHPHRAKRNHAKRVAAHHHHPPGRPGPSTATAPAVLGPTAPPRHVLTGRTVIAASYADAAPIDLADPGLAPPTRPRQPARSGPVAPRPAVMSPHAEPDWAAVPATLRTVAHHPTAPLLVGTLIGLFLLVQSSIDRDDPKLARGHRNDPPDLRFGPVIREVTAP